MRVFLKILAGLLSAVLLALLALTAVYWQPDKTVAELIPKWAPAPSTFLTVDGMSVHLRDEGPRDDPKPILLLHGTAASLHTWQGWSEALRLEHRVIRLDLPGFGLTGPFPDGNYSMDHYVVFLAHFMDALNLPSAVVAGNSFGGNLAWHTAAALPARVQKLILVDAAGYPYSAKSTPIGFRIAQIPVLRDLTKHVLPRAMVSASVRNVYGDPSKVTPELVDRYFDLTLRAGNREALSERFRQVQPGLDVALIPKLKQPTLILWGRADRLIPPDNGEHFRRDIEGSQLVMLDGLGHVPHEEDPTSSLSPVQTFLSETSASR